MPKLQSEKLVSMTAIQLQALWRTSFGGYSTPKIVVDSLRGNSWNNMLDICMGDQRSEWLVNPNTDPIDTTEAEMAAQDEKQEVCI